MENGIAGPLGPLAQEEGSQGVEPVIIHPLVGVESLALVNSMKANSAKMTSSNIFGKWIGSVWV